MAMGVATTRETTDSVLQVRRHPKTSTLYLYKFAGLPTMKRKQYSKHTKKVVKSFQILRCFFPKSNLRGLFILTFLGPPPKTNCFGWSQKDSSRPKPFWVG